MPKRRTAIPRCAMILAAGLGTRMRPLTDKLPKPLVALVGDDDFRRPARFQVLLELVGPAPFFLVNSDTLWIDGVKSNLERLAAAFRPDRMDALLLLAPTATSVGYNGRGDFSMTADGRLRRRNERDVVPFVYAGIAILSPALFKDAPSGAFALTQLFDRAIEQERLFGLRLEGVWMHVGTPDAVAAAERAILASAA